MSEVCDWINLLTPRALRTNLRKVPNTLRHAYVYELRILKFRNRTSPPWRRLVIDATSSAWRLQESLKKLLPTSIPHHKSENTNFALNSSLETQQLLHGGLSLCFSATSSPWRLPGKNLLAHKHPATPILRKRTWHRRGQRSSSALGQTGNRLWAVIHRYLYTGGLGSSWVQHNFHADASTNL